MHFTSDQLVLLVSFSILRNQPLHSSTEDLFELSVKHQGGINPDKMKVEFTTLYLFAKLRFSWALECSVYARDLWTVAHTWGIVI